jgi:ubiquinone biosynthesis protein UbiJ
MADYQTPLPRMFAAALEGAANHVLSLDEASARRIGKLQDKVMQLDLEGLSLTLFFSFGESQVKVSLDSDAEPDTHISGSPIALFQMAGPEEISNWGLPDSNVHISGDASLARDMERLFSKLEPDWEGQLSGLLGDVLGFQVAQGFRQGLDAIRQATRQTGDLVGGYLRDESPLLARVDELDAFRDAVDTLNTQLDDMESRLTKLTDTES